MRLMCTTIGVLGATLPSLAMAASIIATVSPAPKTGGEYFHVGPSNASGVFIKGQGNSYLSFAGGPSLLLANDYISGFSSTPAVSTPSNVSEGGFSGTFNEIYTGATKVVDGVHLIKGVTSILSGNFTDGVVSGNNEKASFKMNITDYASPFTTLGLPSTGAFFQEFNLYGGGPVRTESNGYLWPFSSNGNAGNYYGAVPEPTAWALMLVGFGGIGVAMRRRKMITA